jgi:hypothetical protein
VAQDGKARGEVRGTHVGEHFEDAPLRGLIALRPPGDFHDDIVIVAGTVRLALGHLHDIPMTGILGLNVAELRMIDAADAARRIACAADQPRDPSAAVVDADRQNLDRVVVHQRRRVGTGKHQRCRPIDGQHEHIPVGPAPHAAGHPLTFSGRGKSLGSRDRLSVAHHRPQALRQGVALAVGVESEALGEARHGQRLVRLRQVAQDELAAGNGMRIAHLLMREIRILLAPFAALLRPRGF